MEQNGIMARLNMNVKNKKAFTLVELLVVISIIASLFSILMPALSTARSHARTAICKSNVRQLILANTGYANENDNYYVPAAEDVNAQYGGLHRWHGARPTPNDAFDPLKGPLVKYLADGKVKECPEKKVFIQSTKWDGSFEKGCGGYGYNMAYIGGRYGHAGVDGSIGHKLTAKTSDIGRTAETVMFADSAYLKNGNLIEYSFAEAPYSLYNGRIVTYSLMYPTIHFRHRGKANVGWVDGHISSQEMAKYEGKNAAYLARFAAVHLGWFGPLDNSLFDLK
jgi:prepilin-type N-terminal cleavage/methylation domain-containing protein/prepilin-type processing-associated H-X9-DG protein